MRYLQRQIDDLRILLDERAENQKINLAAALASAKEATGKAELAANARFESVNEFRAQLTDQAATFFSRVEAEARLDAMYERIQTLETRLNTMAGADAGASQAANDAIAARRAANTQSVAIIGAVLIAVSIAVVLILGLNG
jgi:hypothetical protein